MILGCSRYAAHQPVRRAGRRRPGERSAFWGEMVTSSCRAGRQRHRRPDPRPVHQAVRRASGLDDPRPGPPVRHRRRRRGLGNHALGRKVIQASRTGFGLPPTHFPLVLEPVEDSRGNKAKRTKRSERVTAPAKRGALPKGRKGRRDEDPLGRHPGARPGQRHRRPGPRRLSQPSPAPRGSGRPRRRQERVTVPDATAGLVGLDAARSRVGPGPATRGRSAPTPPAGRVGPSRHRGAGRPRRHRGQVGPDATAGRSVPTPPRVGSATVPPRAGKAPIHRGRIDPDTIAGRACHAPPRHRGHGRVPTRPRTGLSQDSAAGPISSIEAESATRDRDRPAPGRPRDLSPPHRRRHDLPRVRETRRRTRTAMPAPPRAVPPGATPSTTRAARSRPRCCRTRRRRGRRTSPHRRVAVTSVSMIRRFAWWNANTSMSSSVSPVPTPPRGRGPPPR